MNKKILILLAFVLSIASGISAQKFSGRWNLYPTVGQLVNKMIDTGTKTYFITGSNLYHYSEADNETFAYAGTNTLSDVGVSDIYFNYDTRKLLVIYSNANLDIIDEDGAVLNVPDIANAVLSSTKGIRDVDFKNDLAYIATDFGLVVVNMETGSVEQSGIYGFGVDKVVAAGDYIVAYFMTPNVSGVKNQTFYMARRDAKLSSFSAFKPALTSAYWRMIGVDDTHFLAISNDAWRTRLMTLDPATNTISESNRLSVINWNNIRAADGRIFGIGDHICHVFDSKTLTYTEQVPIPAELMGMEFSFGKEGYSSIWGGGSRGLGKWDLKTGSTLIQPFFPQGLAVPYPHLMRWDVNGRLWVSNLGGAVLYSNAGNVDGVNIEQYVNAIDGDKVVNMTPTTDATGYGMAHGTTKFYEPDAAERARYAAAPDAMSWSYSTKKSMNTKNIVGGPNKVQPDPDDPDMFWTTNATEGLFLCKKGEGWSAANPNGDVLCIYNRYNMPYEPREPALTRAYDVELDPEGNLWVGFRSDKNLSTGPKYPFYILPSAVRKSRPAAVKYDDWVAHPFNGYAEFTGNVGITFARKSRMAFAFSAIYTGPIYAIDTRGTYADPSDDIVIAHNTVVDQDNNVINPLYYTAVQEDKNGWIWVTYTEGVFVIQDAAGAASESMRVRRPVVPRNDGTNFGDYLLDGANISGMAVDPTDRKWFSTFDAGVYLVSADGTKVLEHFDKDNSPLVSNTVYSVTCDPNSNRVFFGTDLGLISYDSDASPASPDYSDVYVYPNPVRPEYNGWITIAGLMDNSLIKIADMSGNVVFQGRSSGGSFIWDGCNSAGQRVRTGVYLVLASTSGESDSASAIVSKIMIMN